MYELERREDTLSNFRLNYLFLSLFLCDHRFDINLLRSLRSTLYAFEPYAHVLSVNDR